MKEKKETSYELLLQQQRVFLQWQMDHAPGNGSKQKMILPAPSSSFQTGAPINSDAYKLKCAKLEDMKGVYRWCAHEHILNANSKPPNRFELLSKLYTGHLRVVVIHQSTYTSVRSLEYVNKYIIIITY